MPVLDQKTSKSTQKGGSLTGDKTRKATSRKKKKTKKSSKCEPCPESKDILEVEGLCFQKEVEDSDSSNNKTTLFPNLSTSDITVNIEHTHRTASTDSLSTRSSTTRQTDTGSSLQQTKSDPANTVDSLGAKLSNVSLKSKNSKTKTKSSGCTTKKESAKTTNKKTTVVKSSKPAMPNIIETIQPRPVINESIRWENELENVNSERERIHVYKINRRKRYLASAQVKGLGWVKQYGVNGFPLTDDLGVVEMKRDMALINDYSPVNVIRNSQSHSILNEGQVISY